MTAIWLSLGFICVLNVLKKKLCNVNVSVLSLKMSTLEQVGEEVVGQARCPFESRQSNVGLFAGEWMVAKEQHDTCLYLCQYSSDIYTKFSQSYCGLAPP